jgi:hypothetical protein
MTIDVVQAQGIVALRSTGKPLSVRARSTADDFIPDRVSPFAAAIP